MLSIESFKRILRFKKKRLPTQEELDQFNKLKDKVVFDMNRKFAEIRPENIKPYPIYGYCPDECMFLSVTEKDQTDKKEPHICTRYNKQIKHGIFHPHLPKLKECDL